MSGAIVTKWVMHGPQEPEVQSGPKLFIWHHGMFRTSVIKTSDSLWWLTWYMAMLLQELDRGTLKPHLYPRHGYKISKLG
jgi:hypothetical protein